MVVNVEKKRSEVGLACFMQGMQGKKVYIELRNEEYVFGILETCDSYLNLRVRDATVIRNCNSHSAEEFFVAGRHVRFVHFEHQVDAQSVIRRFLKSSNPKNRPNKRMDQLQSNSGKITFQ